MTSPTYRYGATAAICLLACTTANAAFLVSMDQSAGGNSPAGGPPHDHVFFHNTGEGAEVIGTIGNDPDLQVKFYDAGADMHPQGNGHAWLAPSGGMFDGMKIAAHGDTLGFTAIQFNIHAASNGTVTLSAIGSGGGSGGASRDLLAEDIELSLRANGQNRLTFVSDEPFTEIQIDSNVGIENIRQVRVTAAVVPEPLTSAAGICFIAAFAARRRRL